MANTKKAQKGIYKHLAEMLPALETAVIKYHNTELTIKKRLTMQEMSAMTADIVNSVIDMQNGQYNPEYIDVISKIITMKHYAGIDLGQKELPAAYRVITETDLYASVVQHIDHDQYESVLKNAEARIEYEKSLLLSAAGHKVTDLLNAIEQMMSEMKSATDAMDGVDINQLMEHLNSITGAAAVSDNGVDNAELTAGA